MEFEGKDKIYFIGSVILFIIMILLYATYFLFNRPVDSKRNTSEAMAVNTAREAEVVENGEVIAKVLLEDVSTMELPEAKMPVKEETQTRRAGVKKNVTNVTNTTQTRRVEIMEDEIIEED